MSFIISSALLAKHFQSLDSNASQNTSEGKQEEEKLKATRVRFELYIRQSSAHFWHVTMRASQTASRRGMSIKETSETQQQQQQLNMCECQSSVRLFTGLIIFCEMWERGAGRS